MSFAPGNSYAASSPTSQQLNPLYVDHAGQSNVNYVLWSKLCGSSECFRLERIDIADDTSSFVTAPPLSNVPRIAMGGLEQLDFANSLDGFELLDPGYQKSTQLYATFDGGRSWHHEDFIAGEIVERITSTPSTFYIIGGVKCSTTNQLCLRWQLCSSPVAESRWTKDSRPYDFGHDSIYPAVAAFGDRVWVTTQEQSKPYLTPLATSTNSGRTFRVRTVPNLPSVACCGISATSVTTIWAQCDDGNMTGDIEYSNDGGVHWRNLANVTLGEFFFGTFDPVSDNVAFFLNGVHASDFCELIDGASKSVIVGKPPHPQLSSLSFTSQSQGLALSSPVGTLGRQILYETTDGGANWKRVFG
jgi:hypothetical protein